MSPAENPPHEMATASFAPLEHHRDRLVDQLQKCSDLADRYRELLVLTTVIGAQVETLAPKITAALVGVRRASPPEDRIPPELGWARGWWAGLRDYSAYVDEIRTLEASLAARDQQRIKVEAQREFSAIKGEAIAAVDAEIAALDESAPAGG